MRERGKSALQSLGFLMSWAHAAWPRTTRRTDFFTRQSVRAYPSPGGRGAGVARRPGPSPSSPPWRSPPLLLGPGTSRSRATARRRSSPGFHSLDNTDVYAFRSPGNDGTVTLISNWIPFEEPSGGPNFYPFSNSAKYDINIDNTVDGQAGHHLSVDVLQPLRELEHVPYKHRRRAPT